MLILHVLPKRAGATAFAADVITAQFAPCFSIGCVFEIVPNITAYTHA